MEVSVLEWLRAEAAELTKNLTDRAKASGLIAEDASIDVALAVVDPTTTIPRLTLLREVSKANYIPLHPAAPSLTERREMAAFITRLAYLEALHKLIDEQGNVPTPACELTTASEKLAREAINRAFEGSKSPLLRNLRLLRSPDYLWQVWVTKPKPGR